jgi:hypothetical protein
MTDTDRVDGRAVDQASAEQPAEPELEATGDCCADDQPASDERAER